MSRNLVRINCGEVFGIAQVKEVFSQFSAAYEENLVVSIDISRLKRIDTAALQLLYSFQRDAIARGIRIYWSRASTAFCDAARILGRPVYGQ